MVTNSEFKNKKVLITGGLGFIGSNLARRLFELGADVTVVDSMISDHGGNLFNLSSLENKIKINISDVRDEHSMKFLVKDIDFLFNLAGQTSHLDSMTDPFKDLDINAKSQLSVLETCRNFNQEVKVIFTSTRQIYGKPQYLPVDEKHLVQPVDVNGINKLAGESFHILYNNVYGIQTCALRLTNTYGPHMRVMDARQNFLGIWIRLLVEDKPIEVWGGDQIRDFNFVDDVTDALLLVAIREEADGRVFNLGYPDYISLKELAELLIEVNGNGEYSIKSFPSDRKRIDIGDYYADYSQIQETLAWQPKVSLKLGLKKTIDFYKQNLAKYI